MGDKTGMAVSAALVGDRYICTCTMRGLHTHFPPHEPYSFTNDGVYYTVGDSCA